MKYIVFILIALFFSTALLKADMIVLKDGQEFIGKILKVEKEVRLKLEDGTFRSFPKDKVIKIVFHHQKGNPNISTISDLKDSLLKKFFDNKKYYFEKYPTAAYVTLYSDSKYIFNKKRTYQIEQRTIILVLKERGRVVGNNSIVYNPQRSKVKLEWVRTLTSDGKIWYLDDSSLKDGALYPYYPPYNLYRKIKYAMKKVEIGSILDIKTTITYKKPYDLLHPFFTKEIFRSREPIVEKKVTFIYPDTVNLKFSKLNWDEKVIKEEKHQENGVVKVIFTAQNLPEVETENYMPVYSKIFPTLVVGNVSRWESISDKYGAVLNKQSKPKLKMKKILKKLLTGVKSERERMDKIYQFVAREIKRVGVPVIAYSFTPKTPDEILTNGFANMLDRQFLLFNMLKEAGIKTSFLMVSPSYNSFCKEVPSLKQLTGILVKVNLKGEEIYLDPENYAYAAGEVSSYLRGTHALEIGKRGSNVLTFINLPSPEDEYIKTSYTIKINNKDFSFKINENTVVKGRNAAFYRASFKGKSQEELKKFFETAISKIHPLSKLLGFKLLGIDKLDPKGVFMKIDYLLFNYVIKGGNKIIAFKLPFLKGYSSSNVSQKVSERKWPIELDGVEKKVNQAVIELPAEYKLTYFPQKISFSKDGLKYEGKYRYDEKNNKLYFEDVLEISKVSYPRSFYASLKECYEKRFSFAREWIVLEKK